MWDRGLPSSRSGWPVGVGERGRTSHTILPHNTPVHSPTWMATLLANNDVPSGTSDRAGSLRITSGQRNHELVVVKADLIATIVNEAAETHGETPKNRRLET